MRKYPLAHPDQFLILPSLQLLSTLCDQPHFEGKCYFVCTCHQIVPLSRVPFQVVGKFCLQLAKVIDCEPLLSRLAFHSSSILLQWMLAIFFGQEDLFSYTYLRSHARLVGDYSLYAIDWDHWVMMARVLGLDLDLATDLELFFRRSTNQWAFRRILVEAHLAQMADVEEAHMMISLVVHLILARLVVHLMILACLGSAWWAILGPLRGLVWPVLEPC